MTNHVHEWIQRIVFLSIGSQTMRIVYKTCKCGTILH